jgi:hypothetical protein
MGVSIKSGSGNEKRQWQRLNHNVQRRRPQNGLQDGSTMVVCGIVIAIDGGGNDEQWQRDSNLMRDGHYDGRWQQWHNRQREGFLQMCSRWFQSCLQPSGRHQIFATLYSTALTLGTGFNPNNWTIRIHAYVGECQRGEVCAYMLLPIWSQTLFRNGDCP